MTFDILKNRCVLYNYLYFYRYIFEKSRGGSVNRKERTLRYLILFLLVGVVGGCAVVKLPVKAAKVTVKTAATGVKAAGKGVKAVVD